MNLPDVTMNEFRIEDFIKYVSEPNELTIHVHELWHFLEYLNENPERKEIFWYAYQEGLEDFSEIKKLYNQFTNPIEP